MSYDRRLETAERCASLLQRVMFKAKTGITDGARVAEIDEGLYQECVRGLSAYIAARERYEVS